VRRAAEIKPRAQRLLTDLGLWDRRDETVGSYSRGMQQKVAIAAALITDPPILLLDEPTIGLDVEAARTVKDWIAHLAADEGKTIVLTTHQLAIVQELAGRIAVIRRGEIIADLPTAELMARFAEDRFEVRAPGARDGVGRARGPRPARHHLHRPPAAAAAGRSHGATGGLDRPGPRPRPIPGRCRPGARRRHRVRPLPLPRRRGPDPAPGCPAVLQAPGPGTRRRGHAARPGARGRLARLRGLRGGQRRRLRDSGRAGPRPAGDAAARPARALLLELERTWNHLNDIAAVCAGVGMAAGNAWFLALTERARRLNATLTGHRFLFSTVQVGGSSLTLDPAAVQECARELAALRAGAETGWRELAFNGSFQDRLGGVGVVDAAACARLGVTGPAARAAGLAEDIRMTSPYPGYEGFCPVTPVTATGDVRDRLGQRMLELRQAFGLLDLILDGGPVSPAAAAADDPGRPVGAGLAESPRALPAPSWSTRTARSGGSGCAPRPTPSRERLPGSAERCAVVTRSRCMAASGCDDSAAGWLAAYQAPLVSFVLPIVNGDRQAAEDVVQETMLRGWQHAGELVPEHAGSWLHKVARNIAISTYHRRRGARPREVPLDESTVRAAGDGLDSAVDALLIASALNALSADHRRVIVELFYRRRPVAEVAALLGIPEGTVRSRCFYGLRVLRRALEDQGITGP
jgi:RNA polymerase sigma factor (sigma-70 family)